MGCPCLRSEKSCLLSASFLQSRGHTPWHMGFLPGGNVWVSMRSTGRKLISNNPPLITDGNRTSPFLQLELLCVAQYLIFFVWDMGIILKYTAELLPKKRFLPQEAPEFQDVNSMPLQHNRHWSRCTSPMHSKVKRQITKITRLL